MSGHWGYLIKRPARQQCVNKKMSENTTTPTFIQLHVILQP